MIEWINSLAPLDYLFVYMAGTLFLLWSIEMIAEYV